MLITLAPHAKRVADFDYVVLKTYPHDPRAFTQGLIFDAGRLFESTGRRGLSTLRTIDLEKGQILIERKLPAAFFGEGIAISGQRLIQLTWKAGTALVWDLRTLRVLDRFAYHTEGWGLTFDGQQLIMSDGSSHLYFRDPTTFKVTGKLQVQQNSTPVDRLNELEYIGNYVFANVWLTNDIVIIDPGTGNVVGRIDLKGLDRYMPIGQRRNVLNGIAYHAGHETLLVTGKLWSLIFEIGLVPR